MTPSKISVGLLGSVLIALLPFFARAADVHERSAVILSEGSRLHAEVYTPASASVPLPTIIMAHGWGGRAAILRPQTTDLAQAGYLVIAFDYRGWGGKAIRA